MQTILPDHNLRYAVIPTAIKNPLHNLCSLTLLPILQESQSKYLCQKLHDGFSSFLSVSHSPMNFVGFKSFIICSSAFTPPTLECFSANYVKCLAITSSSANSSFSGLSNESASKAGVGFIRVIFLHMHM